MSGRNFSFLSYGMGVLFLLSAMTEVQALPKCLHVMSYHQGYEWNDGIEAGVENVLRGKCQLRKVYMDSKRNTSPKFIKKMALRAKLVIEDYKPDIVIVSDDNASRYLVQAFYKNSEIPFVFNGVNWTAEVYGYPYKNVTGMVEVAPVMTMLEIARRNVGNVQDVAFLSADVLTEHKDYKYYERIYGHMGIKVHPLFVKNMQQWKEGFIKAQESDFIILGNNAGVNDWDNSKALTWVNNLGKQLTLTTYQWMMPFTMLGVSKVAAEQGEWAAEVALEVLAGTNIADIPITINRRWLFYQNKLLLLKSGIQIDNATRQKAISNKWTYGQN